MKESNMKTLFRIMALFMLLFGASACGDDDEDAVAALEVSYANLNGTWRLAEWNGQPPVEGTYCYITFSRKDKTFEIYQKFDSMYARRITGKFTIELDNYLGYIISGTYDFGKGKWNDSYIVTDLLPSGSMIWTVKDDATDVSKYVRCDKVPSHVIEEARTDNAE